ncbi:MAG TPA: DUF4126 family protein [Gemmatimonadales bacterium]
MRYLLAAHFIGFVAGLRSLTPPAAVSWGAWLGWLHLQGSPFGFMASGITVTIFSTLALVELITDKLPQTPNRTKPGPLMARMITGGLAGGALSAAGGNSVLAGVAVGALGGLVGAFAGYEARRRLVTEAGMKDGVVALLEDVLAIGLACLLVWVAGSAA